ncbi:MAG: TetR/AcrR family transcriptional regulator [Burkholderiaceae bacterium]
MPSSLASTATAADPVRPRQGAKSGEPARTLLPRQRRKEARPQELLDAALALFAHKGYAATRTDEVAARAGVSKGTLYLYYPSKEELFKAVVRHNLSALIAEGAGLVGGFAGSTSELLHFLLTTWWERVGSTAAAGLHRIVFAEMHNFPELAAFYNDEVLRPADRLFSATLRRGVARGEFRALPEHEVAHALMAPLIFMTLCQQSFRAVQRRLPATTPQALIRTHLDLVLHGLQVRDPAPAGTAPKKVRQPKARP